MVANALLVRVTERHGELAIRASRSRPRTPRQTIGRGRRIIISRRSCDAASALALGTVALLPAILPPTLPRADGIHLNKAMLVLGIVAATATILLSTVAPVWRRSAIDIATSLKRVSDSYVR